MKCLKGFIGVEAKAFDLLMIGIVFRLTPESVIVLFNGNGSKDILIKKKIIIIIKFL